MLCGVHNHDLTPNLSGHLLAGRLRREEKQRVILTDLKEKNKESVTLIKQVYNAQTRWRKGQRENKTELQYLITELEKHRYVYFTRANSELTTLEDLFFAHTKSIDMLNTFPTVLVMDSTYKTNTYRMPLFEIVGVTSTKLTYSVAFSFLSFERENKFIWTLEMLVGLLTSKNNMPKVIVTDRDPALMKVVSEVLLKRTMCFAIFILGRMSNLGASRIVESIPSQRKEKEKLLTKMRRKRMMTSIVSLLRK
ncbi:putative MULE transposase domain, FHY3/FAR1 family [Medicago truncatula]|uniref:Putative MULE transposase domain, FHY3/FAR1 family n=1 Tax=Medicago truncatula TaxID=3880 RepID=A0A396IHG0_MEDTR|nr:putative MULE transposase domain, FHY3/FAR1 family [Medicago truncatula]